MAWWYKTFEEEERERVQKEKDLEWKKEHPILNLIKYGTYISFILWASMITIFQ